MKTHAKSSPPRSAGTTLIEALAGTVLLATVLVPVLLARTRMERQSAVSAAALEGCQVLQELLESWPANPADMPADAAGAVPGRPGWLWRSRMMARPDAEALEADVLAVEVVPSARPAGPPAARVELLRTRKPDEPDPTTQPGRDAH